MTVGDEYRTKAAAFHDKAKLEIDPVMRAEFVRLAQSYMRLALLAERNSQNDVTYETPPIRPQQQQQIQPKPKQPD